MSLQKEKPKLNETASSGMRRLRKVRERVASELKGGISRRLLNRQVAFKAKPKGRQDDVPRNSLRF